MKPSSSATARREPEPGERVLQARHQVVEQRALARPVERGDADPAQDQRGRPARGGEPGGADDRRSRVEHPVVAGDRGEPPEQAEVDAEGVGVPAPRLHAVEAHADEHHDRVDEHQDRQRRRLARGAPAQLADPEAHQADGGRNAAEPLGIGEHLRQRAPATAGDRPDRAADRAPRRQQPPHVAGEQRRARNADPERHVDHPRGEVVALALHAGEAGVDAHEEHRDAEGAGHHVDGARQAEEAALPRALEPRLGPLAGQRGEGEDQHRGGGGAEQLRGDRQVGTADDAVREHEHGARV